MRTLLPALICLLAIPTSICAADLTADAKYGVKHTQERVLKLPQDQGRWYVSLYGDPTSAKFQKLQEWFRTHPGLVNLRAQVHYNEYSTKSLRYQQRYAKNMPGLPCVRVQNSQGVVTSEFWAEYIPLTGDALYRGIREDLRDEASWGCLRRRRCPCPQPQPEPQPPIPIADDPPVFDEPEPERTGSGFPWLLALAAAVLGAGVGVGQGFKEEHLDAS